MSSATLDGLPNELFELIVCHLDLEAIRNLRLASRSTANKATQDTFRSFSESKHVDLTRSGLEDFVYFTSASRLGCLVENLSLVGVVHNPFALENIVKTGRRYALEYDLHGNYQIQARIPCNDAERSKAAQDLDILRERQADDDDLRAQGTDMALLRQAFSNLAARNPRGLQSLSLQVMVYRDDSTTKLAPSEGKCWRWVFEAASRTFSLTMSCLHDTQLSVQSLDIFSKKPDSLGCSLPCDALARIDFDASARGPMFTNVKTLSICISDQIFHLTEYHAQDSGDPEQELDFDSLSGQERDPAPIADQMADEANYSSLAKMLGLCHRLEELAISGYYQDPHSLALGQLQRLRRLGYMHYLAKMKPLPHLRKIRFTCRPVREFDLISFLVHHSASLRELELTEISIDNGTFAPVFFCFKANLNLDSVVVRDCFQNGKLLEFRGEREQEFTRIEGEYLGRNVVRRWGEDVKKEIWFWWFDGEQLETQELRTWRRRRRIEFGRVV